MISKILVALDESENSRKALTFSAELASKVSSELLILTVIPPVSPSLLYRGGGRGLGGGGGGGVARAQVVSDRIDDVESSMEDKHQKILSDSYELVEGRYPEVNVSSLLYKGPIAQAIVDVADEMDVDLIVVGSGSKSGLRGLILGSVSKQVADDSSKPVLIVK